MLKRCGIHGEVKKNTPFPLKYDSGGHHSTRGE